MVVVNFAGVLDVTMVAAAIGFAWLLMKAVSIVDICLAVVNSSEVVLDAVIGIVLHPWYYCFWSVAKLRSRKHFIFFYKDFTQLQT